ncbi:MAG: hypothetical protein HUU41_11930, partial [Bryobacteraceae bacterium]|nr:hypothetical protein [Bryobacteraceae bacterium]
NAEILYYVPGLPQEYHSNLWGRAFSSVPAALEALFEGLEPGAAIAVIPEGPYVLAKIRSLREAQAI